MASRDIYAQMVGEDVQEADQKTCPECSDRMTINPHKTICENYGLLIDDEQIDHGPGLREFDED